MAESIRIGELLTPQRVVPEAEVASKKRLMEVLSELLAQASPDITQGDVLSSLLKRERLGSTGLGRGVALPHGRMAGLDHCLGAFVKVPQPIQYDAIDGIPVDLVFALLVPEQATEAHLNILARLAELFGDREACEQLRQAHSGEKIHALLTGGDSADR